MQLHVAHPTLSLGGCVGFQIEYNAYPPGSILCTWAYNMANQKDDYSANENPKLNFLIILFDIPKCTL